MAEIDEFLKNREASGLLRSLKPVLARSGGSIRVEDREYIDFCSNDYLGLSSHPDLIKAGKNAIDEFGASSSGSRLLSGDLSLHHQLEEKTAKFKNTLLLSGRYKYNRLT